MMWSKCRCGLKRLPPTIPHASTSDRVEVTPTGLALVRHGLAKCRVLHVFPQPKGVSGAKANPRYPPPRCL